MASEPQTIILGERRFEIRPLTLGQVRKIDKYLAEPVTSNVDRCIAILKIALERDHKDMRAFLDDEEGELSVAELAEAMKRVLRAGGFVTEAPKKPGEDQAAGQIGHGSLAA